MKASESLIKICPRCGSCFIEETGYREYNPYRYVYVVQCRACGFSISSPIRREDVREQWNTLYREKSDDE